jgi:hypothetical protein
MTELGFDNAEIALRKGRKTAITKSFAKTFLGRLAAAGAGNLPGEFEAQGFS